MNASLPTGSPPGLPDAATLARLANEFFTALPGTARVPAAGGVPVPPNPQPPGLSLPPGVAGLATPAAVPFGLVPPGTGLLPTSPAAPAHAAASAPALLPHAQAPNGVPDHVLQAAPGYDGRFGAAVLGVPEAQLDQLAAQPFAWPAVELPRTAPASTASPVASSAAFYFAEPGFAGPHTPAAAVPQVTAAAHPPFDVHAIRRDFPILQERINGRQLVWFDNAATTHKPQAVIDRLAYFYENAREIVRRFIGAGSVEEIVFVRGTTEAINLVAKSWGAKNIGPGDQIIVSHLEHHANIVPWQQLASEKGAKIRVIPVDDAGQVILSEYQRLLNDRTKIVAVTQVSNALGTVVPVAEIVEIAHRAGVRTLVDGAQSVSHMRVDVRQLDCDFFVFSGHKIFGPTGIGVVYGKREVLQDMPPWQGGGNMIQDVTFERTVYHPPPMRFEAGTGNIADAVGLGAALEFVERIGIENIGRYEHALLEYATAQMKPIPGLRLIGTAADKASVLSFVLDGHTTDAVGQALNDEGIAVRTGHHCAQPILRRFGLETTVRPSLAFYNTCEEVDRMVDVVRRLSGRRR
jgi:cysteine desulfurase/selenocysteine lyase